MLLFTQLQKFHILEGLHTICLIIRECLIFWATPCRHSRAVFVYFCYCFSW